jgi:lipopolysaccharide transport system ATP-binding protein
MNNAIEILDASKEYTIYDDPKDRLLQLMLGRWKQFGKKFTALSSVRLSVAQGDVVGVIGRNGAGKSTLLQLLCGTVNPSSGSIKVQGRVAALLELGSGFNPEYSGRDNIHMNAAILGLSAEETEKKFDEIVDFSGVRDFIDQPVKTYSSGMMMRLAFSVAVHVDPDVLIVDEALSVGDGLFARKSFDRIMKLKEKGTTIFFCSHSMYQIEALCNKAIWLERGQLMAEGAPGKVVGQYNDFLKKLDSQRLQEDLQAQERAASQSPETAGQPEPSIAKPVGSGVWRITKVTLTGPDGIESRDIEAASLVSDIAVNIEFEAREDFPPPSVGFVILGADLQPVTSAATHFDHLPVTLNNGIGRVSALIKETPLLKGSYSVDAYLLSEDGVHVYSEAKSCCSLTISQPHNKLGVFDLPVSWEQP